jgi:hypothetical protein
MSTGEGSASNPEHRWSAGPARSGPNGQESHVGQKASVTIDAILSVVERFGISDSALPAAVALPETTHGQVLQILHVRG